MPNSSHKKISVGLILRLLLEVPSAVIVLLPYILPVIGERLPLKVPLAPSNDQDELLKEPVTDHLGVYCLSLDLFIRFTK